MGGENNALLHYTKVREFFSHGSAEMICATAGFKSDSKKLQGISYLVFHTHTDYTNIFCSLKRKTLVFFLFAMEYVRFSITPQRRGKIPKEGDARQEAPRLLQASLPPWCRDSQGLGTRVLVSLPRMWVKPFPQFTKLPAGLPRRDWKQALSARHHRGLSLLFSFENAEIARGGFPAKKRERLPSLLCFN